MKLVRIRHSGLRSASHLSTSFNLIMGGTVIGDFIESMIQEILSLPDDEVPVYVMPVGVDG